MGVLVFTVLASCGQPQSSVQTPLHPSLTPADDTVVQTLSTTMPPTVQVVTQPTPTSESPSLTTEIAQSHGELIVDLAGLIDQLQVQGLTVERIGYLQQPFLRSKGTHLRLSGGKLTQTASIQVYEYNDADWNMNAQHVIAEDVKQITPDGNASWIQPDGNESTMNIAWVAPPHFFRMERAIVIYVGTDQIVLNLLTSLLGSQFAGQ